MNFKSVLSAVALAATAMSSQANITLDNADGSFNTFKSFDWASSGVAWTNDFDVDIGGVVIGSTFDLYYVAHAIAVLDNVDDPLNLPGLDNSANGVLNAGRTYEYTIVAKLTEKVMSCTALDCTFQVQGGSYSIFYDTGAGTQANRAPGGAAGGYGNGIEILKGSIFFGAQNTFNVLTGGQVTLAGTVDVTDNTYINPDLTGTLFVSTLQLSTGATLPTTIDTTLYGNLGVLHNPLGGNIALQADANQAFTVPEPGALALAGLALLGLGAARRRRS